MTPMQRLKRQDDLMIREVSRTSVNFGLAVGLGIGMCVGFFVGVILMLWSGK